MYSAFDDNLWQHYECRTTCDRYFFALLLLWLFAASKLCALFVAQTKSTRPKKQRMSFDHIINLGLDKCISLRLFDRCINNDV